MIHFILNDQIVKTTIPSGTTLLDFIRYEKNLTGTKIGCREGDCGACTILVGEIVDNKLTYSNVTSCLMALGNAHLKHIVTIEGLNLPDQTLVQKAFIDNNATQCGFCTPGFIVSLSGCCINGNIASAQQAIDAMNGNICRCTGYKSIERAAAKVADQMKHPSDVGSLQTAVNLQIVPEYFLSIQNKLKELKDELSSMVIKSDGKRLLAGGTDLYVQQHEQIIHEHPELLTTQSELRFIEQQGNTCTFGAATTVADMATSPIFNTHFKELEAFIKLVSSTPIRNMATIAGNFVNASPIGDLTVFFLALDAQLTLSNKHTTRSIPLRSFYKGYKILNWQLDEHIQSVSFELPTYSNTFSFEKVCKRTYLDIASVNSAMQIDVSEDIIQQCSISAGGVNPYPTYLTSSCAFLKGKVLTKENIEQMLELVQQEIAPISDARGTASYKRLLLNQLIKAHFIKLFPSIEW